METAKEPKKKLKMEQQTRSEPAGWIRTREVYRKLVLFGWFPGSCRVRVLPGRQAEGNRRWLKVKLRFYFTEDKFRCSLFWFCTDLNWVTWHNRNCFSVSNPTQHCDLWPLVITSPDRLQLIVIFSSTLQHQQPTTAAAAVWSAKCFWSLSGR